MKFTYPVYVPSVDKHINFRELLNKHYIAVLKFIANEDDINLEQYFNKLIDHLNDDVHASNLNKIDKFCVLLSLRITCIGPELSLELTCSKTEQKYSGTIDLYAVLSMVSQLAVTKSKVVDMGNGIKMHLTMPVSLYYGGIKSSIDAITDVIQCVQVRDIKHDMSGLSLVEKNSIIDHLPGKNFDRLLKFVSTTQKKFSDLVVFKDKSPHDDEAEFRDYKLGLYDNSMYEMLKLCYNSHIAGYYNNMYTLCDTMGFTADYVQNITPAESNIFINQKKQEVEKQKQQQQQKQNGPTVGSPQSHGNLPGSM